MQRNGAGVTYLSVFHPDIVEFLSTKKENADEKVRVKTLSLGVVVPDKYYELVEQNKFMHLFSPRDVEREYGMPFSYVNITEEYDNMVANNNIKKYKIDARELEQEISKLQQESGYPYVINIDTVNDANPVNGKVLGSNLCSEIFQVQSPSIIRPDQSYEQLGVDIVCNLGSSIMSNLIDADNFALSVETMIRGLSNVADEVNVEEVPTIQNGNDKYHAVGLGVMDAHGAMAKHGIFYGEDESLEMVEAYFSALRYEALKASMNIAIEKNERFFEFDKSAYADGTAFDHIIERDFKITSPKVKEIMSKVPVPTKEDWIKLAEEIKENGLYNGYLLATAPTGSISYVRGVTASLQPIVQKVEERQEGKTGKTFYPAPYMEEGALPYYKSAYEIDMRKMIDVYAVAQKYVDQGMSLTLFMPSEIPAGMYEWKPNGGAYTTRDLSILRNYAWNSGIKSIYYVRTFTQDGEVSNVNMCESCSV